MKEKKISLLLSLLFPGLGQFYRGKYGNGVIFMAGAGVLWAALWRRSAQLLTGTSFRSYLVIGSLIFIYIYALFDAYKTENKGVSPRPLLFLGFVLFSFLALTVGKKLVLYQQEYQKSQEKLTQMKTSLPLKPKTAVRYPVNSYLITTGGFCWLMASAGIAHYLEPDIDFYTFVLYGQPTLFMAGRNKKERYGPGLNYLHAFKNLGYTLYHGSTNPEHPPENVYPDIEPENFIYFKNKEEEFLFAKRLLSAGLIPMVNFRGDFVSLTGYDEKGVWLGFPEKHRDPKKGPSSYLEAEVITERDFFPYSKFFSDWGLDHYLVWMEKTGSRKSEREIFEENKKNALEAPANIKKTIEFLRGGGNLFFYTHEFDTPSAVALYKYFSKKGNKSLAEQYLKIAETFDRERQLLGPEIGTQVKNNQYMIALLSKIQPLAAQAAQMWP